MSKLTLEQERQINLACAKYLNLSVYDLGNQLLLITSPIVWSPATDANDMNKVITEAKLDVFLRDAADGTLPDWCCSTFYESHKEYDLDRDTAILKCVISVLGLEIEL